MNWTGGTLGRSRNARTSLSIIQKKHFAKARGKLQIGRPSPPSVQFFELARLPHDSKGRDRLKSASGCSQTKLGQCVDPGPSSTGLESFDWSKQPQKLKKMLIEEHSDDESARDPSININSSGSSVFTLQVQAAMHQPVPNHPTSPATQLEAKRCQLLSMSDWVGISHLKPAKVDFANFEDRDQIGKRRHLSQMDDKSRPHQAHSKRLKRTTYFEPPPFDGQESDISLSQADISVRIGSAVDRSLTHESEGGPQLSHDHASVMSDEMLLDEKLSDQAQSLSRSVKSDISSRASTVAFSQYRHRRVLTSSAFIDNSTSPALETETLDNVDQGGPANLRRQAVCQSDGYLVDGALHVGFHTPQAPSQFRLAFDRTPRPLLESPEASTKIPLIRDFRFEPLTTGTASLRPKPIAESRSAIHAVQTAPSSTASNEITHLSPFSKATSKDLTELQTQVNGHTQPVTPGRCETDKFSIQERQLIPNGSNNLQGQVGNALRQVTPQEVRLEADRNLQTVQDKEVARDAFVERDVDERLNLQQPKPSRSLVPMLEARVTEALPKDRASTVEYQDIERPTIAEDEEKIWRSFVFETDEESNEWDLGHQPENSPQDQSGRNPPSMKAEVATSPNRQNPYLEENSPFSPSSGPPGISSFAGASPSSSLRCSHVEVPLTQSRRQRSFSSTSPLLPRLSPSSPNQPSLLAEASSSSHNLSPSSISAQPSSTPHRSSNFPPPQYPSSDTDELAWSPARFSRPSVFSKKPGRHLGGRSAHPPEPIIIGRKLLRSGKRESRIEKERTRQR